MFWKTISWITKRLLLGKIVFCYNTSSGFWNIFKTCIILVNWQYLRHFTLLRFVFGRVRMWIWKMVNTICTYKILIYLYKFLNEKSSIFFTIWPQCKLRIKREPCGFSRNHSNIPMKSPHKILNFFYSLYIIFN